MVELLDNRRGAAGDQLANINKNLARLVRELEKLCAEYVPENPPPGATRH